MLSVPELYSRYFIHKNDERRMLFEKISILYRPERGIYPGSFAHITPSFYIKRMTYIDSDRRMGRFFSDPALVPFVDANKTYDGAAEIDGYQADYNETLPVEKGSFDILFSFYAGFISRDCKGYLKEGGILVCNNSHGDASIAAVDKDYSLMAVVKRRGEGSREDGR